MNAGSRRQVLAIVVLVGLAVAASVFTSPARAVTEIEGLLAEPLRFALALVVLYSVRPLVAWPISLCSVLCGYAYGTLIGFPVALVGAVGSCFVPFFIARSVRSDGGLLGWLAGSGDRFFDATGDVRGVFAARLAPTPADAVSYGAGLTGIPVTAFAVGTLLGEVPWTVAFVFVGASMNEFSTRAATVDGVPLAIGAAVLGALALAGPAYRYLKRRSARRKIADGSHDS